MTLLQDPVQPRRTTMAKRFEQTTGPSQRQQRVAELIRHALAEVLSRGDLQDDVLTRNVITIPEVRMSPDLRLATAYVMPLGGRDEAPVLEALNRNRKALRAEVARRVNLKFAPRSEEHTSELQSRQYLVCRLLLEKKKNT